MLLRLNFKIIPVFVALILSAYCSALRAEQIYYGHNLSPTTNTLKENQAAFGLYVVAIGLSDNLMIGSSPWITFDYNMANLAIRYAPDSQSSGKISFQTHYFKTYNEDKVSSRELSYKMETISQYISYSTKISPKLDVTFNLNGMYFWEEERPFSLRRINATKDSYQINTTLLFQNQATKNILTQFELGILGANYTYPQLILGTSGSLKIGSSWLVQLGFMMTSTPKALTSTKRADNNFKIVGNNHNSAGNNKDDFSIHPEIQLEYFF